jgi:hypothetical protein
MAEKTVKVCDLCGTKISEKTCPLCEKDFCEDCKGEWPIIMKGTRFSNCCNYCYNTLSDMEFPKMPEELDKALLEFIKKSVLAENICSDKKKKLKYKPLLRDWSRVLAKKRR